MGIKRHDDGVVVSFRIGADLVRQIDEVAARESRHRSQQIEHWIKQALRAEQIKNAERG